jgi:prepilin-type N-terminal cleavage/methylation domain-containing protein
MHLSPSRPSRSAFSLMELMVVITIIAILSSIILPAGHAVQKNMKKVDAQKTCTELRTSLMSYFTEYKRFPAFEGGSAKDDVEITTDASTPVMGTLLGIDAKYNRRGIQFFSTRPAKRKGFPGLYNDGSGSVELLDPFLSKKDDKGGDSGESNPYHIKIDANYDNTLKVPSRDESDKDEVIYTNVAVWSLGPDGQPGGTPKSDDITAY